MALWHCGSFSGFRPELRAEQHTRSECESEAAELGEPFSNFKATKSSAKAAHHNATRSSVLAVRTADALALIYLGPWCWHEVYVRMWQPPPPPGT